MGESVQPIVVVSKCLGFAPCRYNGVTISDAFVDKLRPHVAFCPVCPEVEIGLGVPRSPVRVVSEAGEPRLLQPATGADLTVPMQDFAATFLDSVGPVDGFILKGRSPSCGLRDTKAYAGPEKGPVLMRTSGFFGAAVLARFGALAVEDEGRLTNSRIREHFLAKLFTLARFRALKARASMNGLVRFQAENKLLLMAHHQAALRILGRIVANRERLPVAELLPAYEQQLAAAFERAPRCGAHANVLMHALGYFSERLSPAEKAFFLEALESYRAGQIPLSALIQVSRSWIVRFGEQYLAQQTFFAPFPEELFEAAMGTDACKARDYWPQGSTGGD